MVVTSGFHLDNSGSIPERVTMSTKKKKEKVIENCPVCGKFFNLDGASQTLMAGDGATAVYQSTCSVECNENLII